jgi:mannose-6-phosphate isomerase-like protein (cupin superfamily)
MNETRQIPTDILPALLVAAGEDRFGEHLGLGISTFAIKLSGQDLSSLFILEVTLQVKGGPGRHVHYDQDEWFYALEGEFILEEGSERYRLKPGDSVLGRRRVPHVWAHVGEGRGRILGVFTPAGQMEAFAREAAKANVVPSDPALFRKYGMDLVGPPLPV